MYIYGTIEIEEGMIVKVVSTGEIGTITSLISMENVPYAILDGDNEVRIYNSSTGKCDIIINHLGSPYEIKTLSDLWGYIGVYGARHEAYIMIDIFKLRINEDSFCYKDLDEQGVTHARIVVRDAVLIIEELF